MGCCSSSNPTNFKAIEQYIRPLDVIAFRGNDPISDCIVLAEKIIQHTNVQPYSHVGIVVNTDIMNITNGVEGKLYVLESTFAMDVVDVESKKSRLGVQIRPLEEAVESYLTISGTKAAFCKLLTHGADSARGQVYTPYATEPYSTQRVIREKLVAFKEKIDQAGYNFNILSAVYTCCAEQKPDSGRYYCSQLVAELFRCIGVYPQSVRANTISPVELLGLAETTDCPKVLSEPIEFLKVKGVSL